MITANSVLADEHELTPPKFPRKICAWKNQNFIVRKFFMNPFFDSLSSDQKKLIWEQVGRVRDTFNSPNCFSPSGDCDGTIISAHTIQRKALSIISRDGHVYDLRPDLGQLFKNGEDFRPELKGIKQVSTFNGFCEKHDCELFKPIETEAYTASGKQHFSLFFRALAKEMHDKIQGIKSFPALEELQKIHPNSPIEVYRHFDEFRLQAMVAAIKMLEFKSWLNSIYMADEFRRIQSYVATFKRTPSILCAGFANLLYDFNGMPCQNLFNAQKFYPAVSISVFPTNPGGAVVFSWPDIASKEPIQFCKSFDAIPSNRKTSAIIRMLFEYCGNIALSPEWWESLDDVTRNVLTRRFYNGLRSGPRSDDCLMDDGLNLDDWQVSHACFV